LANERAPRAAASGIWFEWFARKAFFFWGVAGGDVLELKAGPYKAPRGNLSNLRTTVHLTNAASIAASKGAKRTLMGAGLTG